MSTIAQDSVIKGIHLLPQPLTLDNQLREFSRARLAREESGRTDLPLSFGIGAQEVTL
jgi:hypothetical protein